MVDFHWNASDPWTIVSVSDDCGSTGGGGTLQVNANDLCSREIYITFVYNGERIILSPNLCIIWKRIRADLAHE